MSTFQANLEMFAAVAVLGLGLLLASISFLTYRRLQHARALFIGLGFLTFAIQGGYLVLRSLELRGSEPWLVTVSLFDLFVLLFLYLALRIR